MKKFVPWWVKPETAERLRALGEYGDTQDDIVCKILDNFVPDDDDDEVEPVKVVAPVKAAEPVKPVEPERVYGWQPNPDNPDEEICWGRGSGSYPDQIIARRKKGEK